MKHLRALVIVCVAPFAGGCNLFLPIIFAGEHQRQVPAEFDKLPGARTVVLIWAEPETLFDYPHIRLELASFVGEKIRAGIDDCEIVDETLVEDFLQRHTDAAIDPRSVGDQFDADAVVYIELLEFQMREPQAPELLRGRITASVTVFDLRADPDQTGRYPLEPVKVVCPAGQPLLMSSRNGLLIRRQSYEQFSEAVARKFYEHKIDL